MKKITMVILLFVISAVSFFVLFYRENYNQLHSMRHAEQTGSSFQISISGGNKSTQEVYAALKKLLDKYQGNIFFTRLIKDPKKSGFMKYIYLTDLSYFNQFRLQYGDFLSLDEMGSNKYLSTIHTGDSLQTGQIMDFAGNDVFEIRTLKSMTNENTGFDGNAVLQLAKPLDIDLFIDELNQEGIYCIKEVLNSGPPPSFMYLFSLILLILYFVLALVVFFDVLSSYKKIGVYKMFGYKNSTIWLKSAIPVIIRQIFIFSAVCIISSFIAIKEYNEYFVVFLVKLAFQSLIFFSLTFIFTSLPFLYLPRITVSNMLKNKRPVEEIITANTVIKTGLSVFLIVSLFVVYSQYTVLFFRYSGSYKIWEATKDYAIIPAISNITNDFLISDEFGKSQKELYMYFNKKGAVLADFNYYSPYMREELSKTHSIGYKRDYGEVNPNYLKINPIYDVSDKKINIDESESSYILLIPEKYYPLQHEISEYHQFIKNGYRRNKKSIVIGQDIKIIWTKNGQKLFSYRIDVSPSGAYKVKDPVIRVITEFNGDIRDYDKIIGYAGNPFKIKVDDPSGPSASIRPVLNKYNLSKYIPSISTVFDYVAAEIKDIMETLTIYLVFILLLSALICIIIIQNIYNYFEQHRMRLAIQQFHGYKRRDRYGSYFALVSVSWLMITILSVLIYRRNMLQALALCIACMALEVVLSFFAFAFVEKRKSIIVLKGG